MQPTLADDTIQGNQDAIWEETIAYMAEAGADTALFRQIVAAVRDFLRRFGLVRGFTNADVAHLARGSVERVIAGRLDDGAREPVYAHARYQRADQPDASATDQTQTPEFRRWFGDSKVVDADGKPLVVYHGTRRDFNEFSPEYAPGWGRGIYFTDNPSATDEFSWGEGGRVIPAYVRIEDPFRSLNENQ